MIYYLGGVNGVGKTTFLDELIRQKPDAQIYYGSKSLLERLGIKPGDYESLRKLPTSYTNAEYANFVIEKINCNKDKRKLIIFDSHYLNMVDGNIFNVTGGWIKNVDCLLLLTADIDDIFCRIIKDESIRDRRLFHVKSTDKEKFKTLLDYSQKTKERFLFLAEKYGLNSHIIFNFEDNISEVVKEFINFDKQQMEKYVTGSSEV